MDWILLNTLVTAISLALACALLSIVVVLRRWAFIGEGISHSSFGGAGTAWLLMLLIPSLQQPWLPYVSVVIFCLATAVAIGALSRGREVNTDVAIGIFMVASLAWGFLARQIYVNHRGTSPTMFEDLLFGQLVALSPAYALTVVATCTAVVAVVCALWKEIAAYAFDPMLATTSGVRAGFIHYLLMFLIALVIVMGVRVAGSILVTALLVLPGATALLLSRKLGSAVVISIIVTMIGTIGGMLIGGQTRRWSLPAGPVIVLILFAEFLVAWGVAKFTRRTIG